MADKKEVLSTLKQLAEMYHQKEARAVTDDDVWHINGVFMKAITTRKDFFIHAITAAPNELITIKFFSVLYGVMEFSYREKGIYIQDQITLGDFCKTEFGMSDDDAEKIVNSYSIAVGYGFELTEEIFYNAIERLSKRKKQMVYRDIIKQSLEEYKKGDIAKADELIYKYVSEANALQERNKPVKMSTLAESAIDRYNHSKQGTMIKAGIAQLDHITGGGRKGLTWIVAGYTADGKTTYCANIAYNVMLAGKTVLWVTLELPKNDMETIFWSMHAKTMGLGKTVTFSAIDEREMGGQEFNDFKKVIDDFKKYDNLIIYEPEKQFTLDDLVNEIDRIKAVRELDCVVVDYLELIDPTRDMKYDPYRIRIKRIMRDARLMSRRKNVWTIIPHQISRSGRALAEERGKDEDVPYYQLADMQESSGVEQNCAVATWIYQDDYLRGREQARIGIAKNTKGKICTKGWDIRIDFEHRSILPGFVPKK